MFGALCLVLLSSVFLGCNGLIINITNSRVLEKYDHIIAAFGPDYEDFTSVKGEVVFGGTLCPAGPAPTVPYNNSVVFAWRGDCTFAEKVYFAQQNHAVGVVVGNYEDGLVRMGSDSEVGKLVTIPAVFISQRPAKHLVQLLDTSPLVATINQVGEAGGFFPYPDQGNWWIFQWILYVMVFAVAGVFVVFLIRNYCIRRRMQVVRTNYARRIPVVEFRAPGLASEVEEKEEDARTPLAQSEHRSPRVLNETCAVCLDDFTAGQRIKVLPCRHGFHIDCIDPWLNDRSEFCPVCKASILEGLPPERSWLWCCRGRQPDPEAAVEAPQSPAIHPASNVNNADASHNV